MLDSVCCPEKGRVNFVGGVGHSLNTSMYGKKLFYCAVILSIEVLTHGTWSDLKKSEDLELIELAGRLSQTIIHSRADSTVKKYLGAFRRWKVWASQYFQSLMIGEKSQSKSAVQEACSAVAWVYSTVGLPTPTTSPFVKAMLEGMQQLLPRLTVKKASVTPAMLEGMVKDTKKSHSLCDLRLTSACLLAYAGFLQFNELVKPCDITIQEEK